MMKEDESVESKKGNTPFYPAWNTANPHFYHLLKDQRKVMRDNMTEAETVLWKHIKSNKLGVKFRRQHIIEYFIPDFVALSCKLIIEVDGEIHKFQKKHDLDRELFFREKGYRVIRFENNEVLNNIEFVVKKNQRIYLNGIDNDLASICPLVNKELNICQIYFIF